MSIPVAVGKTNPFSNLGGAFATASSSGANAVPNFGDFQRLVDSQPLTIGSQSGDGQTALIEKLQARDPNSQSALATLVALRQEGEAGRSRPIPEVHGRLQDIGTVGVFSVQATPGDADAGVAFAGALAGVDGTEPNGEGVIETQASAVEESVDAAVPLPVAVAIDSVVNRPLVEAIATQRGGGLLTGEVAEVDPAAIETPPALSGGDNDAIRPELAARSPAQGLPVPGPIQLDVAGSATGQRSQRGAILPVADIPAPVAAAQPLNPGGQVLPPPENADDIKAANIKAVGEIAPTEPRKTDEIANSFGQRRAEDLRSESARQALANTRAADQTPSGEGDTAATENVEAAGAQKGQIAAARNEPAPPSAASAAAPSTVSSLVDPLLKAEAAAADSAYSDSDDTADIIAGGSQEKASKNKAAADTGAGQNGTEAQSNRRSGVSGAALAFAAAVSNGPAEGFVLDGATGETLDGLGLQNTPIDTAAGRQAPQAAQQLPQAAQVAPQIAVHIARHTALGSSRFQIRLDPADLGSVDVELKITADGIVKAHLTVERSETLDLFLRDQRSLERALDAAGLKVVGDALQFSLKDQGDSSLFAQGDNDGQFSGESGRDSSKAEQAEAQSSSGAGRVYVRGASGALDVQV